MLTRIASLCLLAAALAAASAGAALADYKPTVALLRFGMTPAVSLTDKAALDTLEAYGYLLHDSFGLGAALILPAMSVTLRAA